MLWNDEVMYEEQKNVLLIGANGTIGGALADLISSDQSVKLYKLSRDDTDYSEESLANHASMLKLAGAFSQIICCIGTLHNDVVSPEKRLSHLSQEVLSEYFHINTILPALCIKHFVGLLDKRNSSQFIALSAMVGSIGENQLGGWYGYRSSKAALNMMIKTASIEVARSNKSACLAVIHPGTTQGPLSKPFASGVSKDKYYTPAQSAERIWTLSKELTVSQTGSFFNWDGSVLEW